MRKRFVALFAAALLVGVLPAATSTAQVPGTDVQYTSDADFDQGTLVSVNHDAPFNDQLQLDSPTEPFPFINVAASGRGTVVRVNTDTGEVVGEYRTAPEGRGLNPSRTTVDLFGNVWTANREEVGAIEGVFHGSAVKIGLIAGGSRVNADGTPNPVGGFLAPPFGYSTCVDRNNDGLIRTSSGLGDILAWPDVTDGLGGATGVVEDAVDECVLVYQRLPNAEQARHVSVDADNNVWVGGYPFELRYFHKLDGATGEILDSFDARTIGCGGYGGLVDGNGILWSVGFGTAPGPLLRYDPATGTGSCVNTFGGYGLGIDTNGYLWTSLWENGIAKVSPSGVLEPGYPKSTLPPSSTASAAAHLPQAAGELASIPMEPMEPMAPAADNPTFSAAPDDNWVGSGEAWTPGATISLSVEDGSGVVYADSQPADSNGFFWFNLWEAFDLERGHMVTVSDGTTTKTHTVTNLFVDGIDVVADTVSGRADAGTAVDVWVDGAGGLTAIADGSGNWTADFSGTTDLTYASQGGSHQSDPDGDATFVWWAAPAFQTAPDDNWVGSSGKWTPGATISLTVEDGGGVVYTDGQPADSNGFFNFNLQGVFDLERGQVATVSDGTTTKTHTVTNLFVDGIDLVADTVFGRADAGTAVDVWVDGAGGLTVIADGSGNWTADFSGTTDITYASQGGSRQFDSDGDDTGVFWRAPTFTAAPDDDWVASSGKWTPGATISLTVEDGGGVVYTDSQVADTGGSFFFNLQGVFDLERGHMVTVSDGTTTKTHTVTNLFVDGVDLVADTVSGRADAGTAVDVWVDGAGGLTVIADGSGNWTADFSGTTDITYASQGGSRQFDSDGDDTGVFWRAPTFTAALDDDWVGSSGRWTPGATISLTVEDGGGVVYTDSQVADTGGSFFFNLQGVFDLKRGQVVTVSDGTATKTHTATDVDVTEIDTSADTVTGTAEPNASVQVGAGLFADWSYRWVEADGAGNWTADFAAAAGDQPALDITDRTVIDVDEFDDDGDATRRRFGPPIQQNRGVAVTPVDNHVWVANSGVGTVTRLDNDGNVLKVIETGSAPTGVAVDANGKVWATNLGSDNTVRIDPAAGSDGLGAVDLTVDLGAGASPYNYSDMTGAVVVGSTSPQGFWTVVQDSGEVGFEWGRLSWNSEPEASEPAGTEIVVEIRTSDSEAGLGGATFIPVPNGELFSSFGRFIEVRVTLKASPEGLSPVLSDIRVQPAIIEVDIDIKPGSYPNSINTKAEGVIPVAILGSDTFDVSVVDTGTVEFGPNGATPAHPGGHLEDVNLDSYMDLMFHFPTQDTGLAKGDTEACLVGMTLSGVPIHGCDSVRIVK